MTKVPKPELGNRFSQNITRQNNKSKTTAALLAILFGDLGLHKFYLGKVGWGLVYLFFFWSLIPAFVGIIEGIIYLTMSDQEFKAKYC